MMGGAVSIEALVCIGMLVILLFPIDIFRRRAIVQAPGERVDERDTMFARMARVPATPEYDDYYARHPDLKARDERIRRLPALLEPGGLYYDTPVIQEAKTYFETIDKITVEQYMVSESVARLHDARSPKDGIRRLAQGLGAVAVGFTTLEPEYLYTEKGRFDANYGEDISLNHRFAVVFLVEMGYEEMQQAPHAETLRESARQYYRAAHIAKVLEAVLVASGHDAKAHYDAHYDVILPPLAVFAGLGELGRNNILVADRYGSRVRIGAVTTNLPLTSDTPRRLGVIDFCRICKKCADNCPSRALSMDGTVAVRGVEKWPTDVEQCYTFWRKAGTDCGICMAVCPFSHRNNSFHNLVRLLIRLNPLIRRLALLFDNAIYGRRWEGGRRA
jgi:reductive dehalogenase